MPRQNLSSGLRLPLENVSIQLQRLATFLLIDVRTEVYKGLGHEILVLSALAIRDGSC